MNGLSPVFVRLARSFCAFIIGCLVAAQFAVAGTPPLRLVIVTHVTSSIGVLSQAQARKIYLGVPLDVGGKSVQPLINRSNQELYEVFLQKVLFMSAKAYERHMAHAEFAADVHTPLVYRSESKLIDYLNAHPNSIACLTEQSAVHSPSLRVIARL